MSGTESKLPRSGLSLGTSMVRSVRAEPPMPPISIGMILCWATPIDFAIFFAASISRWCRWPYLKVRAYSSNPSSLAMARVVAESGPPLSSTTALSFCFDIFGPFLSGGCIYIIINRWLLAILKK